jgi:outer membrane protein insertion porin family
VDLRDDHGHGLRLLLTNEVAGGKLGGDQHFAKNEVKASYRAPLNENGVTFGVGFRAGVLAPLQDLLQPAAPAPAGIALPILRPRPSHIGDRFFLGGTLDVRGFHFQSIGPRTGRYASGADAFWAAAGHIWTPLPGRLRRHIGDAIQVHGFLNAGSAVTLASAQPAVLRAAASQLSNDFAAACGVGLSATLSFCTVEVNYCVPLRSGTGALPRPGLTASVGFEML